MTAWPALIVLFACDLGAAPAFAAGKANAASQRCDQSILSLLGRHAGVEGLSFPRGGRYPSAENGGVVVAAACKAWPGDKSRTVAAVAYDAGVEPVHHGFSSLRITSTSYRGESNKPSGPPRSHELHYDGERYRAAASESVQ